MVPAGYKSVWAQYTIRLQPGKRDPLAKALQAEGIPTAIYYAKPLHVQTAYRDFPVARHGLPVSERLADEVISLPMHAYLDERDAGSSSSMPADSGLLRRAIRRLRQRLQAKRGRPEKKTAPARSTVTLANPGSTLLKRRDRRKDGPRKNQGGTCFGTAQMHRTHPSQSAASRWSRASPGFARDIMLAAILGAGPVADAFFVALRLPNHFRAIFAEGAFNAAFVPAYARIRTQDGPDAAQSCLPTASSR